MQKSPIFFTVLMSVFLAWPGQAYASTYFVKMFSPTDKGQSVTGDIETLQAQGFLNAEMANKIKQAGEGWSENIANAFKEAADENLTVSGKPAQEYIKHLSEIDYLFDLVEMKDGFGPLVNKQGQLSSVQFYNNPDRKIIFFPLWPSKIIPVASDLYPALSRDHVSYGMFLHEVISVLGGEDKDYLASTDLLLKVGFPSQAPVKTSLKSSFGKDGGSMMLSQASGPSKKFDRLTKESSGGGSVVGGGGSDIAFTLKFLLQAIAQDLFSGRQTKLTDPIAQELSQKVRANFSAMNPGDRISYLADFYSVIIEEGPCSNTDPGNVYDVFKLDNKFFLIRICSTKLVADQLKLSPKFLDRAALAIANSLTPKKGK